MRGCSVNKKRTSLTRHLRDASTEAEAQLWFHLRNRQLGGFKFRRQYSIGPYVADFFCHEAGLIVEVDGSQHMEIEEKDAARTRYLESIGLRVVRFTNAEVLVQTNLVLDAVLAQLRADPSP